MSKDLFLMSVSKLTIWLTSLLFLEIHCSKFEDQTTAQMIE